MKNEIKQLVNLKSSVYSETELAIYKQGLLDYPVMFYPKQADIFELNDTGTFFKSFTTKDGSIVDIGILRVTEKELNGVVIWGNNRRAWQFVSLNNCINGTETKDYILEIYKIATERNLI